MVEGVRLYKRDWAKVTKMVRTRTAAQVRSHAQKWFDRLEREGGGENIPVARKKRRCSEPYPKKEKVGKGGKGVVGGDGGRWVYGRLGGAWIMHKDVAKVPEEAKIAEVGVGGINGVNKDEEKNQVEKKNQIGKDCLSGSTGEKVRVCEKNGDGRNVEQPTVSSVGGKASCQRTPSSPITPALQPPMITTPHASPMMSPASQSHVYHPHSSPQSPYHPAYHYLPHPYQYSPQLMSPHMYPPYSPHPHASPVLASPVLASPVLGSSPSIHQCCSHAHASPHIPPFNHQQHPQASPLSHPLLFSPLTPETYPPMQSPLSHHQVTPAGVSKPIPTTCIHGNNKDGATTCVKCAALRKFGSAMHEIPAATVTHHGHASGKLPPGHPSFVPPAPAPSGIMYRYGLPGMTMTPPQRVVDGEMKVGVMKVDVGKVGKKRSRGDSDVERKKGGKNGKRRRVVGNGKKGKGKKVGRVGGNNMELSDEEMMDRVHSRSGSVSEDDREMFDAVKSLQILATVKAQVEKNDEGDRVLQNQDGNGRPALQHRERKSEMVVNTGP